MVYKTAEEIVGTLTDPATTDHQRGAVFSILASRMEDAFSGSKAGLLELSELLDASFRQMLAGSDDSVLNAVIDNNGTGDANLKRAFMLGQLEMASHFINHTTSHRAEDDFIPKLTSEPLNTLARALQQAEYRGLTRGQLIEATGQTEVEVRAAMREMINMGAADFRFGGEKTEYFLTGIGKAVVGHE